jgi:hypothetical protein
MSLADLVAVFGPIFRAISILIAVFTVAVCVLGLWIAFWKVHDHYMQKRIRRGATPMAIDELKMRRLAKSVRQRIQTRKMANGR